jgi:hypothetical protein
LPIRAHRGDLKLDELVHLANITPLRVKLRDPATPMFYWIYDIPTGSVAALFAATFVGVNWIGTI